MSYRRHLVLDATQPATPDTVLHLQLNMHAEAGMSVHRE